MPSLRLTDADSRDIASFLMTQKHADATYAAAPYMDDPKFAAAGKALVQHYGCAGCHEISGLEDEGRIGTELTNEGSKPIERMDFARYTEDAKRGIQTDGKKVPRGQWYDAKGFFEAKLINPAVFDYAKVKPDPMDRLRMPSPNLNDALPGITPKNNLDALTSFLLGSVDPQLPAGIYVQARGPAQSDSRGLVDRHEIQLYRLPPDWHRAEDRDAGFAVLSVG